MNQNQIQKIKQQTLKFQKQSKIIKMLLLPILTISWIVGYGIYCIFDGKKMIKVNRNRYRRLSRINAPITQAIISKV